MTLTVEALQTENTQLRVELSQERHEKTELLKSIDILGEQIAWFKNRLFGRSSEKLSEAQRRQMRLFDEAEAAQQEAADAGQSGGIEVPAHVRRRAVRRPLPQGLPREEVVIDIPQELKHCACGQALVRIGEESSEKLDVIPPRVRVIRTIRPKYACHACEGSGDEERAAVRIAPMPPSLIDKGIASAGLLAFIVTGKFCDALPLYRQEKQFARIGVQLSRRTMADWMIAVAQACAPVLQVLEQRVRAGPVLQIDETSLQVLGEEGRQDTSLSYMWVARGGPPDSPVVVYRYAPSRAAGAAQDMLGEYEGYVQTDGYEVYNRVCVQPGIVHVGCWAHARRMFVEAGKSSKKAGSVQEALGLIGKLYAVEAERQSYKKEREFAAARKAKVEPVLDKLRGWLERKSQQVPPKSALGEAVAYTLRQWPKLVLYLEHPALTPDTNACERAIRPFVLGRKNWLFSGSPRGAQASAGLYSLIETAKANGYEPYWYLRKLFEELPLARTAEDYLRLSPFAQQKDI